MSRRRTRATAALGAIGARGASHTLARANAGARTKGGARVGIGRCRRRRRRRRAGTDATGTAATVAATGVARGEAEIVTERRGGAAMRQRSLENAPARPQRQKKRWLAQRRRRNQRARRAHLIPRKGAMRLVAMIRRLGWLRLRTAIQLPRHPPHRPPRLQRLPGRRPARRACASNPRSGAPSASA